MRRMRVFSLSLPPDPAREAERIAKQEGRTQRELFHEALRRSVEERRWRALQRYGQPRARKLEITEGDVERAVQEVRRGR
jgi:metal-responsive CopG/Arc/MetJ family transcriptional regulator